MVSPWVMHARHLAGIRRRVLWQRVGHHGDVALGVEHGREGGINCSELLRQTNLWVEVPAHVPAEGGQRLQDLWRQRRSRPQLNQVWLFLQQTGQAPLVQLVPHTPLVQDAGLGAVLHHEGILKVGQFMRQHWAVRVGDVFPERRAHDVRDAVCTHGQRLALGEKFPGPAVELVVVLRLPIVLLHRLRPPRPQEFLFLGVMGLVHFRVPSILQLVIPFPPTPESNVPSARLLVVELHLRVEAFELFVTQQRAPLRFQLTFFVHEVCETQTHMPRQPLEQPHELIVVFFLGICNRLLGGVGPLTRLKRRTIFDDAQPLPPLLDVLQKIGANGNGWTSAGRGITHPWRSSARSVGGDRHVSRPRIAEQRPTWQALCCAGRHSQCAISDSIKARVFRNRAT
mmetsp:Transcript_33218/g.91563  ORF Transcript_33218/g.91563 Transcript_33218/m.91563 type:complete len:398 (+) Transcript_33218:595-1788(+)